MERKEAERLAKEAEDKAIQDRLEAEEAERKANEAAEEAERERERLEAENAKQVVEANLVEANGPEGPAAPQLQKKETLSKA